MNVGDIYRITSNKLVGYRRVPSEERPGQFMFLRDPGEFNVDDKILIVDLYQWGKSPEFNYKDRDEGRLVVGFSLYGRVNYGWADEVQVHIELIEPAERAARRLQGPEGPPRGPEE